MNALLLLGLLMTGEAPKKDAPKDEKAIEGTWIIESVKIDGKDNEEIKGEKLIFKDGKFTKKGKNTDAEGTYKLDPAAKPKTLDVTPEGKDQVVAAIYKLDGDKMTICTVPNPGGARPTEFNSKEGSGVMLLELKREKK